MSELKLITFAGRNGAGLIASISNIAVDDELVSVARMAPAGGGGSGFARYAVANNTIVQLNAGDLSAETFVALVKSAVV